MSQAAQRVSTGLDHLDAVLDHLRIGDNVVWRTSRIEDYQRFVTPLVRTAAAQGRSIIYLRFARHAPLIEAGPNVKIIRIKTPTGFEALTREVYQLITAHGRGAFYVFDCLSDLASIWTTDQMIGVFFRVVCPYLFELDTVAYFAMYRDHHAHSTMEQIRGTTQVMIDLHRVDGQLYVQPVKVQDRRSPTMFLPHALRDQRFIPVTDSGDATRLHAAHGDGRPDESRRRLDYWDQLFLNAADAVGSEAEPATLKELLNTMCRAIIGRDERVLRLVRRYLTVSDLLKVHARMIGTGYIGGKAIGMLLARKILESRGDAPWADRLEPHDSFHVGSDVYYTFLVRNGWWPLVMRQRTSDGFFAAGEELRALIPQGRFPDAIRHALDRMLDYFGQYPILVRSSSLLEDGFGNAFAGKYESCFCVNQGSPEVRLARVEEAIRRVYASAMSDDALVYRRQRGLESFEEPMALLIQRVSGSYRGRYYMPDVAGVGVSRNTFVWDPAMDAKAGMIRLVMGLGTRAVDRIEGDHACVIALDHPHKRPFRDQEDAYRFSQHDLDVLDIGSNELKSVPFPQLLEEGVEIPVEWCATSEHRLDEDRKGNVQRRTQWRIDFQALLDRTGFVATIQGMLRWLERAYSYPVDIEFTARLGVDGQPEFNIVQCRPLQTLGEGPKVDVPEHPPESRTFFASVGRFMGGSIRRPIQRLILVDPDRYAALNRVGKHEAARLVGRLNRTIGPRESCPTMLLGPGRWGTSTPELGVPVRFADISRAAVIVEVARMGENMVPDLSFGSHFFQDLVESEIAYVALFPDEPECRYNPCWLDGMESQTAKLIEDQADSDPLVIEAVKTFDLTGCDLYLLADVRSRRLACMRMEGTPRDA
ncbi:MAG: PEP/pyruvate-binding domain-containing protein [Phycisphaeraceae bacterium]|nr:PEP/pyruvate-binding domain-containing protein [Phycisphaeraceae bacterium]